MLHWLFVLKLVSFATCLESPEPELLLRPRNFNPHPYNEGGRVPPSIQSLRRFTSGASPGIQARTGPVLFPPNPEDNPGLDTGRAYAGVARKQKNKLAGRFIVDDQENNINPRVYSGLANYAAKVLKKPAAAALAHNGFPDPSLAAQKKNYAFSYTVRDHATGDDFSHSQSQSAAATNGEYRVKLPDGRVQIVSYTADKNGYKADVKYADDDLEEPHQQLQPQIEHLGHQMQRVEPEYRYYEPRQREQVTQIEVPVYDDVPYHNEYQPEYVTAYPYPEKIPTRFLVGDKVRIYSGSENTGYVPQKVVRIGGNIQTAQKLARIQAAAKFSDKYSSFEGVLDDLPYGHSPQNILGPVAVSVSTASPPHYSQVYITTPKYALSHTSAHPVSVTPTPGYYKRR